MGYKFCLFGGQAEFKFISPCFAVSLHGRRAVGGKEDLGILYVSIVLGLCADYARIQVCG